MSLRWVSRRLITSPYHIGLCTTPEAFARELKRMKVPTDQRPDFLGSPHAHATTHYFEKNDIPCKYSAIVCVSMEHSEGRPLHEIHGLLVHEAVHIWQSVKECLGERDPSREFEAYSVQSISQELFEAWAAK